MTDEKISQYFYLSEVTFSATALRKKIKNVPTAEDIKRAKIFAINVMDKVRERFGAYSPESWFRNVLLNSAVGGAWNSDHLYGRAADIRHPKAPTKVVYEWIRDKLKYDQVILESYNPKDPWSGWVHVSFRATGNRMQAFTK